MESNTSGQGSAAIPPEEIRGWNWGAFFLHLIWGMGNNTLVALFMLVPGINLFLPFVLGARGNEWAWQNKRWESIAKFKDVQRIWAICGILFAVVSAAGMAGIVLIIVFVISLMKGGAAYQMALAEIAVNPRVIETVGEPMETGIFVSGTTETSGPSGHADIAFDIAGPRGEAAVYVKAVKSEGEWNLQRLVVAPQGGAPRFVLIPKP